MPKGTFDIDFQGSQESKCIKTQPFSPAPVKSLFISKGCRLAQFWLQIRKPYHYSKHGTFHSKRPWKISTEGIKKDGLQLLHPPLHTWWFCRTYLSGSVMKTNSSHYLHRLWISLLKSVLPSWKQRGRSMSWDINVKPPQDALLGLPSAYIEPDLW